MKEITLEVQEKYYPFFIDLVKNIDFIHIKDKVKKSKPIPKYKASSLVGKLSPMTNEEIDRKINEMRSEWERSF